MDKVTNTTNGYQYIANTLKDRGYNVDEKEIENFFLESGRDDISISDTNEFLNKYIAQNNSGKELSDEDSAILVGVLAEIDKSENENQSISANELNNEYTYETSATSDTTTQSDNTTYSYTNAKGAKKELVYENGAPKVKITTKYGDTCEQLWPLTVDDIEEFNKLGANIQLPTKDDTSGGSNGSTPGSYLTFRGEYGKDCYSATDSTGKTTYYTEVTPKSLTKAGIDCFVGGDGLIYAQNPNYTANGTETQYLVIGKGEVDEKGNISKAYIDNTAYADYLNKYKAKYPNKNITLQTATDKTKIKSADDLVPKAGVEKTTGKADDATTNKTTSGDEASTIISELKSDFTNGKNAYTRTLPDGTIENYRAIKTGDFKTVLYNAEAEKDGKIYVDNPNYDSSDPNSQKRLEIGVCEYAEDGSIKGYYINKDKYSEYVTAYAKQKKEYYKNGGKAGFLKSSKKCIEDIENYLSGNCEYDIFSNDFRKMMKRW